MSTSLRIAHGIQTGYTQAPRGLAAAITRNASKQTYYTIRLLADRDRVEDAYRAYAYFRWVDDRLDEGGLDPAARLAFARRQQALIAACYRGRRPEHLAGEERLLVDLIGGDTEPDSGLQAYIRNMMAVMEFDARRRGRLVSAAELDDYTRRLAVAVTEAMHHFVGHGGRAPLGEERYFAVTAAHITHMLRDTQEDAEAGYFNVPREWVEAHGLDLHDVGSAGYQAWVRSRVQLARRLFVGAHQYLRQVECRRYRLAVYGYTARFEYVLDAIEREGYRLRAAYPERKSMAGAVKMAWSVVAQVAARQPSRAPRQVVPGG